MRLQSQPHRACINANFNRPPAAAPNSTPTPPPPLIAVDDAGTPVISYTAAATLVPALGNFFQAQALARPANPSDPLLLDWAKGAAGPVLTQTPPGGTNFQVRLGRQQHCAPCLGGAVPSFSPPLCGQTASSLTVGPAGAPPDIYVHGSGGAARRPRF